VQIVWLSTFLLSRWRGITWPRAWGRLSGIYPSLRDSTIVVDIKKIRSQFPDPYWDGVSEPAKNLIGLLLEKDPTKRLTAKQTLEHPWMKEDTPSTTTSAVPPAPHAEHQPPKPSLRESAERPENKNVLRQSLNRSIEVQRDGIHNLKSISESSLLKKRMQAMAGQTQGEDNAQDSAANATDNNAQPVEVLWSSQE